VKLLKVVVEVDLLTIILLVLGLVMQMVEHLQEAMVLVGVVTVLLVAKLEELVEVVVVQVTIITHMVQDLVGVVEFRFNTLEVLEELVVIIGEVLHTIFIMVVTLYIHIVNYGTLRTGK
jgi:hypothetical protein